jgi:hypothetical protein
MAAVTKYHKPGAQTMEAHYLTVQEAGGLRSWYLQGSFLLRTARGDLVPASCLASGSVLAIFDIP